MTDQAMSPLRRRMIEDMTIRKFAPARGKITGLHLCFAEARPAMIRLDLAPPAMPVV